MIFSADDPTPSPTGVAQAAVQNALDLASLIFGAAVGLVIAFVVALVIVLLTRPIARRSRYFAAVTKRVRTSYYITAMAWGAWAGLQFMLVNTTLSDWSNGGMVGFISHALLIIGILTMTWMVYNSAWIFEDAARIRQEKDGGVSRKFETQAQVIRRLLQALVILLGVCAALFTFNAARQAMTTVLASAGVVSVIAGLAAQQTLGNVFAGIQLAFTDAIRVGDVVVVGKDNASGKVEEITLSYVVVRLPDERRLIVPSTYFTSNTFENWTRRAATQLGNVELKLDWAAPLTLIRSHVQKLLLATDLWDGRSWAVQVTDSNETTITVRIVVSAKDSGALWDLRCYLRENMIRWVVDEDPAIRPHTRVQSLEVETVTQDTSREAVARLAKELSGIAADTTGDPNLHPLSVVGKPTQASPVSSQGKTEEKADSDLLDDAVHSVRLLAARQKAKRARRRAMAQRQRELADTGKVTAVASANDAQTQVFSQTMLHSLVAEQLAEKVAQANARLGKDHLGGGSTAFLPQAQADGDKAQASAPQAQSGQAHMDATVVRGERLFSGSPDADERNQIYAGPGDDVLAEREATAKRHEEETTRLSSGPRVPEDAVRPQRSDAQQN
jgi:mechanosensitive ion channel family protein (fragment)